jgi:hypothetical protein
MGKTSLGANQRNKTSGMATPMAAPTSTSVGASAPSATRPSPASATTPAATHLPRCRQRPSGTRVYRITTTVAAKAATCTEGRAQPPQPARISTPNGRGRWAIGPTHQ